MAWIHKETYEILQALESGHLEEYFEADDMIAAPIAMLNQKGYSTVESCAGHPFPSKFNIDAQVLEKSIGIDEIETKPEDLEHLSKKTLNTTFRTYKYRISYIIFECELPEDIDIPEGWNYSWENNMLFARYTKHPDPYHFIKMQFEKMQSLMTWTQALAPQPTK